MPPVTRRGLTVYPCRLSHVGPHGVPVPPVTRGTSRCTRAACHTWDLSVPVPPVTQWDLMLYVSLYLVIQSPNRPLLYSSPLASPSIRLSGCRNSLNSHENPLRCRLIFLPLFEEELKPKDDPAHGPGLEGLVWDPVCSYSSVILLNLPFLVYVFMFFFNLNIQF